MILPGSDGNRNDHEDDDFCTNDGNRRCYFSFEKDKPLTLVLAVAIPVLGIVLYLLPLRMIPLFKLMQIKIDKINLVLRENLTGIRVIRAFNTIEHEKKAF